MTISIRKPMMRADTGRREVGLAVDKVYLEGDLVDIEITYQRKDGSPLYVNKFVGRKEDILACPQKVYAGVRLAYVPLDILKAVPPKDGTIFYKPEPATSGELPKRACSCGSTKFWLTNWKEYICSACHPSPQIVAEVDILEKNGCRNLPTMQ